MPVAFKEWAITVRALAEGEQLLTLRKGGIREENKHFEIEHDRFFLYPTFDHQRNDCVREAHMPELGRALEEGVWPDNEPPAKALIQDGGIPQPDRVRIRAWAEVAASYLITDPRAIDALSPYYIWTTDYAEKRLAWKRRHPLHVIVLRTYRIPRPVTVKVRPEYHGCRSWIELYRDLPFEGTPVLSDEEFERAPRRSRRSPRARHCPFWPRPTARAGPGRAGRMGVDGDVPTDARGARAGAGGRVTRRRRRGAVLGMGGYHRPRRHPRAGCGGGSGQRRAADPPPGGWRAVHGPCWRRRPRRVRRPPRQPTGGPRAAADPGRPGAVRRAPRWPQCRTLAWSPGAG